MTVSATTIPELGGQATCTLTRSGGDASQPLTVSISSSDAATATVPASIVFAANATSVTFPVTDVHSTTLGSRQVEVTAAAPGYAEAKRTIQVTDSDGSYHNAANPPDTNNDGFVSPLDALLVINYLNVVGPGPVPGGSPPPFLDVNSDNFVSSIDALLVINALNTQGLGEAPNAVAAPADQFQRVWEDAVDRVFDQVPFEAL
jgi:hypothetical protein